MKILVINGHPDKGSFCQEIFRTIVENIDSNHHELESINLNVIDFIPYYVMVIENVWKRTPSYFALRN